MLRKTHKVMDLLLMDHCSNLDSNFWVKIGLTM